MGLIAVPADQIGAVVTTLEMTARPRPKPIPPAPLRLVKWARPDAAKYLALFRRVGEPWLWYSRLVLSDAALLTIIHDPAVEVYAAIDRAGVEVGMLELDFRKPGACEIVYFGLIPELTGQQLGRWLMAEALGRAWRPGIDRVWLNTCTLDHPSAINFYRRCGFVAAARRVEVFPDPRLTGLIRADAAPHVPLLSSATAQ
jgi:GNAT superfamily N-acetyltransferase